jgi:hypothetical protein
LTLQNGEPAAAEEHQSSDARVVLSQDVFTQPSTLALLDAAKMASLQPRRNIGRLWAPAEADALREGVDKYGIGKPST